VLGRPERAQPPVVNPLALARTDRERRARRRTWRRAGLHRDPRCDVPSRPTLHLLVATLHARCLTYAVAPTIRSFPHWEGRQHHLRAAVAALAPAPTSPRRPSPLGA
jgi:hypothetical protein